MTPGVAEADLALVGGRVLLLADGDEPPALDDQPPVAGRVGRPEAEDDDVGAARPAPARMRASVAAVTSGVSP